MLLMRRKNVTAEMMKDFMVDALILLMRDHSYHSITIGQITSKAGVNRSTYYRNFQSKEEIIKRFYCRILDEGVSRVSMPETIVLENYLVLMFHAFYEQKEALLSIHSNGLSYLLLDALNQHFTFYQQLEQGSFTEKMPLYYHTGGIFNHFLLWFNYAMGPTPEEFAKAALLVYPPKQRPLLLVREK